MEEKILNDKEKEIKKRLFSLGSIQTHDRYFYELFKSDTDFTEEEKNNLEGLYILAGEGVFGKLVDDKLANYCIKWILTGDGKYYEIIKDWFKWHLKGNIIENQKKQERFRLEDKQKNLKKQSGYIYLIKSKNLYKIGRAKYLKDRIKTYRVENPFGIRVIFQKEVNDYIGAETKLLKKFKDKNHRGEWFKLTKKDIQWIKQNI